MQQFAGIKKDPNFVRQRNSKSFHTYGGSAAVLNNRLKNENLTQIYGKSLQRLTTEKNSISASRLSQELQLEGNFKKNGRNQQYKNSTLMGLNTEQQLLSSELSKLRESQKSSIHLLKQLSDRQDNNRAQKLSDIKRTKISQGGESQNDQNRRKQNDITENEFGQTIVSSKLFTETGEKGQGNHQYSGYFKLRRSQDADEFKKNNSNTENTPQLSEKRYQFNAVGQKSKKKEEIKNDQDQNNTRKQYVYGTYFQHSNTDNPKVYGNKESIQKTQKNSNSLLNSLSKFTRKQSKSPNKAQKYINSNSYSPLKIQRLNTNLKREISPNIARNRFITPSSQRLQSFQKRLKSTQPSFYRNNQDLGFQSFQSITNLNQNLKKDKLKQKDLFSTNNRKLTDLTQKKFSQSKCRSSQSKKGRYEKMRNLREKLKDQQYANNIYTVDRSGEFTMSANKAHDTSKLSNISKSDFRNKSIRGYKSDRSKSRSRTKSLSKISNKSGNVSPSAHVYQHQYIPGTKCFSINLTKKGQMRASQKRSSNKISQKDKNAQSPSQQRAEDQKQSKYKYVKKPKKVIQQDISERFSPKNVFSKVVLKKNIPQTPQPHFSSMLIGPSGKASNISKFLPQSRCLSQMYNSSIVSQNNISKKKKKISKRLSIINNKLEQLMDRIKGKNTKSKQRSSKKRSVKLQNARHSLKIQENDSNTSKNRKRLSYDNSIVIPQSPKQIYQQQNVQQQKLERSLQGKRAATIDYIEEEPSYSYQIGDYGTMGPSNLLDTTTNYQKEETRLISDLSNRTLSVGNYQINEERRPYFFQQIDKNSQKMGRSASKSDRFRSKLTKSKQSSQNFSNSDMQIGPFKNNGYENSSAKLYQMKLGTNSIVSSHYKNQSNRSSSKAAQINQQDQDFQRTQQQYILKQPISCQTFQQFRSSELRNGNSFDNQNPFNGVQNTTNQTGQSLRTASLGASFDQRNLKSVKQKYKDFIKSQPEIISKSNHLKKNKSQASHSKQKKTKRTLSVPDNLILKKSIKSLALSAKKKKKEGKTKKKSKSTKKANSVKSLITSYLKDKMMQINQNSIQDEKEVKKRSKKSKSKKKKSKSKKRSKSLKKSKSKIQYCKNCEIIADQYNNDNGQYEITHGNIFNQNSLQSDQYSRNCPNQNCTNSRAFSDEKSGLNHYLQTEPIYEPQIYYNQDQAQQIQNQQYAVPDQRYDAYNEADFYALQSHENSQLIDCAQNLNINNFSRQNTQEQIIKGTTQSSPFKPQEYQYLSKKQEQLVQKQKFGEMIKVKYLNDETLEDLQKTKDYEEQERQKQKQEQIENDKIRLQQIITHTEKRIRRAAEQILFKEIIENEIQEVNERQENNFENLKKQMIDNLKELKNTERSLYHYQKKPQNVSSLSFKDKLNDENDEESTKESTRRGKFIDQVEKYTKRIDSMMEDQFERQVNKLKDRRIILKMLQTRINTSSDLNKLQYNYTNESNSNLNSFQNKGNGQENLDKLIQDKMNELEILQKKKKLINLGTNLNSDLLFSLSKQTNAGLNIYNLDQLTKRSVACSAIDLNTQRSRSRKTSPSSQKKELVLSNSRKKPKSKKRLLSNASSQQSKKKIKSNSPKKEQKVCESEKHQKMVKNQIKKMLFQEFEEQFLKKPKAKKMLRKCLSTDTSKDQNVTDNSLLKSKQRKSKISDKTESKSKSKKSQGSKKKNYGQSLKIAIDQAAQQGLFNALNIKQLVDAHIDLKKKTVSIKRHKKSKSKTHQSSAKSSLNRDPLDRYKSKRNNPIISQNSTIVHQCKASAIGSNDPIASRAETNNKVSLQNTMSNESCNFQPSLRNLRNVLTDSNSQNKYVCKRLRFDIDNHDFAKKQIKEEPQINHDNHFYYGGQVELYKEGEQMHNHASGSTFTSARSGLPFNIKTSQGMTGNYQNAYNISRNNNFINRDSGTFEHIQPVNSGSEISQNVTKVDSFSNNVHSNTSNRAQSILKNSSTKRHASNKSLSQDSESQRNIDNHHNDIFLNIQQNAEYTDQGYSFIKPSDIQSFAPDSFYFDENSSKTPNRFGIFSNQGTFQNKLIFKKSESSSEDSDSDIEYKHASKAVFIDKMGKILCIENKKDGVGKTLAQEEMKRLQKNKFLPKWQKLALGQVHI